jgi:hypothetical protein
VSLRNYREQIRGVLLEPAQLSGIIEAPQSCLRKLPTSVHETPHPA